MSIEPFIKCSDINVSLAFYTEILDFVVIQAPDPDPGSFLSMYAFLEREGGHVHLSQHAGDGIFGSVVYVRVKNIEDLYAQFVANGLTDASIAIPLVVQTWGMKEFGVMDPDGNRVTFGQKAEG